MTDSNKSSPSPAEVPPAPGPHSEPDDREEIYFEGSPPKRAFLGQILICLIVGLFLIIGGYELLHRHWAPWWLGVIIILLGVGVPFLPDILAKRVRYRITNYRIDLERGLIATNIDTLELWHVEDLHFHQSILERITNVGVITVIARDETLPRLEMWGIPNPRPLYETLKQRVIAVKRQRGVLKMDPG
jgi:uncharacterized membrane protein YdbT with pleckstrin-like domain